MIEQLKLKILLVLILCSTNVDGQNDIFQLILPEIQRENVQLTAIENNEYLLRISLPESDRTEFISLDSSNVVVQVQGLVNTYYPKSKTNLMVNYVADKNGYHASYKFDIGQVSPQNAISFDTRITASDLKSLAG